MYMIHVTLFLGVYRSFSLKQLSQLRAERTDEVVYVSKFSRFSKLIHYYTVGFPMKKVNINETN